MYRSPLVSVLLPTYNNELYLKKAIQSVLDQTFIDFELIIIDDCSSDNSQDIINYFKDQRIINIRNQHNLGLINSLNKALSLAKGKYIARMDGDDFCFSKRLEIEVDFMEKNPEVILIGGSHLCGDIDTNILKKQYFPISYNDVKANFLFNCPFSHITVMFRKSVVEKYSLQYEEQYKYAEDYALWSKLSDYGKVKNLPYFFAKYRYNEKGQTHQANRNENQRFRVLSEIQIYNFEKLGYKLNEKEKKMIFDFSESQRIVNLNIDDIVLSELLFFFKKVRKSNLKTHYTSDIALKKSFGVILLKILFFNSGRLSLFKKLKILMSSYSLMGMFFLLYLRLTVKIK